MRARISWEATVKMLVMICVIVVMIIPGTLEATVILYRQLKRVTYAYVQILRYRIPLIASYFQKLE